MDPIYDLIIIGFISLIVGVNLYWSPNTDKSKKAVRVRQNEKPISTMVPGSLLSAQSSHS